MSPTNIEDDIVVEAEREQGIRPTPVATVKDVLRTTWKKDNILKTKTPTINIAVGGMKSHPIPR